MASERAREALGGKKPGRGVGSWGMRRPRGAHGLAGSLPLGGNFWLVQHLAGSGW